MQIEIVPCLSDNYAYLIKDGDDCAVLDPSEAKPVQAALERLGWRPGYIVNTHHHNDHVGGNLALKETYGAKVVGPGKDKARIPGLDIGVDEQSGWQFAGKSVRVLEVPGHTRSALTFVIGGQCLYRRHAVRPGLRALVRRRSAHDVGQSLEINDVARRHSDLLRP